MKILVTGGSGHIGSHITERLLARGDQVLVIDNYATGRRDNLQPHANLKIVEGTIADRDLMQGLFTDFKPELVVHAAASYKDPDNWEEDTRTNCLGGSIVAKLSRDHKVRRIIYFQTALCYGVIPLEQPITLDHPLRPWNSSYAISKTTGEHYIALSGVDFISFRLANSYGPRNLSGPLPTFYHRLTNNKKCFVMNTRRDFIFVDDMVDAAIKAIDGQGKSGYYHISSGRDYAIKELYDNTLQALHITPAGEVEMRERDPNDAFTILLDPSKTHQDFGWDVKTPLAEGIRKAIAWYQKYGITQTFTHLKLEDKK